ncbi:MAG: prephenate dehydratase [Megasphaera sp.]|jgi:chorismate mutase/prephenate dehydratase|nr:prephenate dehydratase [Megasphaera sp.]
MDQDDYEYCIPVGCYGAPGSYSSEAMMTYFKNQPITTTYYNHFEDEIRAVAAKKIQYGVIPIENSSTGSITEVYDLIRRNNCFIVGEQCIKIDHHLLALPGTRLEDIRIVYSHPQGFAQCRDFFRKHTDWIQCPYFSTSQSAERVQKEGNRTTAAVANSMAAALYGLQIVVPHIYTNSFNYTRFFIIAPQMNQADNRDKITLVLTTKHEPGALYHVLGHFFYNGMNMTHLESRPMEGHPFEYFFHIDVMGSLTDPGVVKTLDDLARNCTYFKILGNYPSDQGGAAHEIRTYRSKIRTQCIAADP